MPRSEAWYRKIEEQLAHLQRRDAVGQLTEGVAHGFNNLLTVVIGHAELLLMHVGEKEKGEKEKLRLGLEQIRNAGERITALTHQLFPLSYKEAGDLKRLDLNEVVSGLQELLQKFLGESIPLVARLSPAPVWVTADRAEMAQLLINLVLNGREAMPEGGALSVSTADSAESGQAGGSEGHRAYVTLEVTDTGIGIDPAVQTRLFEPFFTTKKDGLGLGLFIVQGIVKRLGGEIRLSSKPGTGCSVQIYLPRAEGQEAGDRRAPAV